MVRDLNSNPHSVTESTLSHGAVFPLLSSHSYQRLSHHSAKCLRELKYRNEISIQRSGFVFICSTFMLSVNAPRPSFHAWTKNLKSLYLCNILLADFKISKFLYSWTIHSFPAQDSQGKGHSLGHFDCRGSVPWIDSVPLLISIEQADPMISII